MQENKSIDKKSFKSLRGKQTNWGVLGNCCLCFSNVQQGFICTGIEDSASLPPEIRKINKLKKSILQKAFATDLLAGREVML